MNKKRNYIVKCLFSCLFFWMLFSFISTNELRLLITNIQWDYFIASFLLIPVMLTTSCLKWKMLIDAKGQRVPFTTLIRIYCIGYFFSNLLPSAVGGDVVRSFYSGKLINNQAYSAVCVFLERFTGILFLLVLVIVSPLLSPQLYTNPAIFIPVILAVALLALGFLLVKVKKPLEFLGRGITWFFQAGINLSERFSLSYLVKFLHLFEEKTEQILIKIERFQVELLQSISLLKDDKVLFLKIFLITAFFYFLTWVNVFVSFKAFNVNLTFIGIVPLVPVSMFVSHVPVTLLGNLGYFESVFVFYFLLVNVTVSESLAMTLLLRVKMLFLGLIGFITYLSYKLYRSKELDELEDFAKQT